MKEKHPGGARCSSAGEVRPHQFRPDGQHDSPRHHESAHAPAGDARATTYPRTSDEIFTVKWDYDLRRIDRDLRRWTGGASTAATNDDIGIELNLGAVTLTRKTSAHVLRRFVPSRKHLRLFHSTASAYDGVVRLEPHIRRVFGEAAAISHSDFQYLLSELKTSGTGSPEECGRILRRERARGDDTEPSDA